MNRSDDNESQTPSSDDGDVKRRVSDLANAAAETNIASESTINEAVNPKVQKALELLASVRQLGDAADDVSEMPRYIGRYQIVESVGRGGFSEVFRAVDEDLSRDVALKIPLIAGRPDCQSRFEREAKLAAMLSHRQIVPVYEFGCVGKIDFIAYAWIEGHTLGDWLTDQAGKVSGKVTAEIVAELARAIHYAHERGVVHRDLKPANILIDQSSDAKELPIQLRTKITDLGLSRDIFDEDQRLTQTGQALGTPSYMSPEQACGADTTFGADIYSLGVILFEMITGKLPFERGNAVETMRAIADDPAPLVTKFAASTSRELAAIVDKCLQKSPTERYATAFDLAEDLDAFVQGKPVSVRPAGFVRRTKKWIARNRSLTATIALVTFSLLAGTVVSTWNWLDSQASLKLAQEQSERADRFLMKTQQTIDSLVGQISSDETLPVDLRLGAVQQAVDLQKELLSEAPDDVRIVDQTIRVHQLHSRLLADLGRYEPAIEAIDEAKTLAAIFVDEEEVSGQIQHIKRFRANLLGIVNRVDEASNEMEAIEKKDLLSQARSAFTNSVRLLNYENKPGEAEVGFAQSVELYSQLPSEGVIPFELAKVTSFLGIAKNHQGKLGESIEQFKLAAPKLDETVEMMPDKTDVVEESARCHYNWADSLLFQVKRGDLEDEDATAALLAARDHCKISSQRYAKLQDLGYRNAIGGAAACHDVGIQIEQQLGDWETASVLVQNFETFYKSLPEDFQHIPMIGRVVVQQYVRLAREFHEDDAEKSIKFLDNAAKLAGFLKEQYGGGAYFAR